jgi:cytochrome P450
MTLYPEVQRKAREEIDRVVGQDRLPNYKDRSSLPYIEAVLKEVLRWNPVAPLGKCIMYSTGNNNLMTGQPFLIGSLLTMSMKDT